MKSLKYFLDKQHSQIIVVIADLPIKSFYCTFLLKERNQ